jgi:NAD(P)-dependent dehydrogenase (short-subunit alcohol dehydrogenase family)
MKPIRDLALSDFQSVIAINITAAFLCTQAALRQFANQVPQGGRIINNGSLSSHIPRPNGGAYAISKHAVWGLTKSTSLEGRKHGVAVTQIDIGESLRHLGRMLSDKVVSKVMP